MVGFGLCLVPFGSSLVQFRLVHVAASDPRQWRKPLPLNLLNLLHLLILVRPKTITKAHPREAEKNLRELIRKVSEFPSIWTHIPFPCRFGPLYSSYARRITTLICRFLT